MLDAGGMPVLTDQIRQPDDDNPRGYYEFEAVKTVKDEPAWLEQAPGHAVKMVYRLLYDLPAVYTYRVVFTRRKLEEVVASQETMLQRNGKDASAVDEAQLVDIYRRQLKQFDAWIESRPNFSILYVEHHEVLADTERVAHELNQFLGGQLDEEAMARVPDRSLHRQKR
ncbi:MAG: sulfotransferase family protein [Chloroflexota bacterium]|nr:sulfotransferase family protein [Chloroflexota bacterium]